ncbi:MAG TPA: S8 family serine peptidase [Gemmatimonadales bacterium]|nr:S8 family serine peptidase [Gemmatimonadales bacterium]
MNRLPLFLAVAGVLACAPSPVAPPKPSVDPGRAERPPVEVPAPQEPHPLAEPVAPPDAAFAKGWMPRAATRADAFVRAHPQYDGRGVLIAILDSGIDAGVPGLQRTPTGDRKLLDLRDFSGEGAVPLEQLAPSGDSVTIGGIRLDGMSRVRALNGSGPWYGGVLRERPLGQMPAADLNGDGDDLDTYPLLVVEASNGWVVLADTDGDGSLSGEAPVRDYLLGREVFGWRVKGRPSPVTVAANVGDLRGTPTLDLFFDTSGHGTHVAGIAAGQALYGVPGFDGVAPGAQLLGLKIANTAHGEVSVTGGMIRAIDYALRFARSRRLPLVFNMSFGVGNEREGAARIDAMIDSVLAFNPDVVFTVSAGNDGPGLSTISFPGSAERVISVGATFPLVFVQRKQEDGRPDPVAFFSSRGGELAKPDIVAPGVAYSSVPRWHVGEERASGTSMAAPHAAGLAALLVSALRAEGKSPDARLIKHALMITARPTPGATYLDQGTGQPDVIAAWEWLRSGRAVPEIGVRVAGGAGITAAYRPAGLRSDADTLQTFRLVRPEGVAPLEVTLKSTESWVSTPDRVAVGSGFTDVTLRYDRAIGDSAGAHTAVVTGWAADTTVGPLFRLVNTVVVPAGPDAVIGPLVMSPGNAARVFFMADSGRPFEVRVAASATQQTVLGALHAPGGRPNIGDDQLPAGSGDAAAVFAVDAGDARAGIYEVDAVAPPPESARATVTVIQSPIRFALHRDPDGAQVAVTSLRSDSLPIEAGVVLLGGERNILVAGEGGRAERVALGLPAWSREIAVDVLMDREGWPRFTDFGVTLHDSAGRIISNEPLNYADARLETDLTTAQAGQPLSLLLTPGLADSTDRGPWNVRLRIRAYADTAMALDATSGERLQARTLAPGGTAELRFRLPDGPWTYPDGYHPLGVALVQASGRTWTHEAGLPKPVPAVAR